MTDYTATCVQVRRYEGIDTAKVDAAQMARRVDVLKEGSYSREELTEALRLADIQLLYKPVLPARLRRTVQQLLAQAPSAAPAD